MDGCLTLYLYVKPKYTNGCICLYFKQDLVCSTQLFRRIIISLLSAVVFGTDVGPNLHLDSVPNGLKQRCRDWPGICSFCLCMFPCVFMRMCVCVCLHACNF